MENEKINNAVPAEPDFETFAKEADQADITARLGTKPPEKVVELKPKAEPEKVEPKAAEELKDKSPHKLTWGQLRAKLREQEAEIRGLRDGKREPEKVEEPVKAEEVKVLRVRPKPEDLENGQPKYKTWEAYEDDLLDWNRERIFSELDERNTKKSQDQNIATVNKAIEDSWNQRCEAASEAHEDFEEALEVGKQIQPGSIVDEWILDSELGAEILYFFHKNPAEMKKFTDIKGPTPGSRRATARRMLMAIEQKIKPTEKETEGEEVIELNDKPKPAEKEYRVSKTPPPAREVGGRGAQPTDRARAAVANDDVGAYIDEANRREIAAKFGR